MKQNTGVGCMMLFFLPFAAVGIFMGYKVLDHIGESMKVSSWEEVPAIVVGVHSGERRSSSSDGDSVTHYIKGNYSYEYNGQKYTSSKISIEDEGGFGIAYDSWEKQIKDAKRNGEDIFCRVNPEKPGEAVLFPGIVWDVLIFYLIFVGAFGGVGIGGMLFCLYAAKVVKKEDALKARYPGEPWNWREEWVNNSIQANAGVKVIAFWAFAIFWNLVSCPIFFALPKELEKENYLILIGLLFPLVGMFLLAMAIRATIQKKKFGESKLILDQMPGVVGGNLKGNIQFSTPIRTKDGFKLVLSCKQTTGSGDSKSTRVIWQSEKKIPQAQVGGGHIGGIPFSFVIPYGEKSTSEEAQVDWNLEISADLPGVDFEATFNVPVFKTDASDPNVEEEEIEYDFSSYAVPVDSKIVVSDLPEGGKQLVIPPVVMRKTGMAVGTLIFTVIWLAICIGLGFSDAPLIFPIFFGLFGVILVALSTIMFFKKVEIKADKRGIDYKSQGLLFSSKKFYNVDRIERLSANITSTTTSGTKQVAHYGIKIKTLIGTYAKEFDLIWMIGDRETTLYYVNLLEEAIGLDKTSKTDQTAEDKDDGPWLG